MSDNILFNIAFLGQVLLLSRYFPWKMLGRMKHVFATYPPSDYPRLYPRPFEYYQHAQHNYRVINRWIHIAGLILVAILFITPRSGEWDGAIATWFFMVQFIPLLRLDISSFKYFRLMREANSRSTRKAELHRRRLPDFISPFFLGLAVLTYIAFVFFIIYVKQFDFPWFGGYVNIAAMTVMNLVFAGMIAWSIYGKKLNPHQAHADRLRQIGLSVKILVFVSIAATVFIMLHVTLAAMELREYQPVVQTLYYQLLAVVCYQAYRIDHTNFDVYKEDAVAT